MNNPTTMIVYDDKLTKFCDKARVSWSKIAKENGWFDPGRPFYVQVRVDRDTFKMIDSIYAKKEATDDIIVFGRVHE